MLSETVRGQDPGRFLYNNYEGLGEKADRVVHCSLTILSFLVPGRVLNGAASLHPVKPVTNHTIRYLKWLNESDQNKLQMYTLK